MAKEKMCEGCDEPILEDEAFCVHDGELMHLQCAAEDMDNADFDSWFMNR